MKDASKAGLWGQYCGKAIPRRKSVSRFSQIPGRKRRRGMGVEGILCFNGHIGIKPVFNEDVGSKLKTCF
jgi:hypothetical protein